MKTKARLENFSNGYVASTHAHRILQEYYRQLGVKIVYECAIAWGNEPDIPPFVVYRLRSISEVNSGIIYAVQASMSYYDWHRCCNTSK